MTPHQLLDALEDKPLYRDEFFADHRVLMDACRDGYVSRFNSGSDCYSITDAGRKELARLRTEVPA